MYSTLLQADNGEMFCSCTKNEIVMLDKRIFGEERNFCTRSVIVRADGTCFFSSRYMNIGEITD
jgi:hypothetical protein